MYTIADSVKIVGVDMKRNYSPNTKLGVVMTKHLKESIGLLSLGTFLEYFDLMLYVHMAFFLNDLFFPKDLPYSIYLISAVTFCSTFVFRPFGALIFGWIGDNIGRKATVTITTIMMAFSSLFIANLPTYNEIGIAASWIIILCRILQGMSSMGEIVGAELYITETTKPPLQYPAVTLVAIFATLGAIAALGVAFTFTAFNNYDNWRPVFWLGAFVGIVGFFSRIFLRESIDFVDAKRRLSKIISQVPSSNILLKNNPIIKSKINKKTFLALLLIQSAWPFYFYFIYIYCGTLLKVNFGLSNNEIIFQNLIICLFELCGYIFLAALSYKIHPLVLVKAKTFIFFPFCLILPYILNYIGSTFEMLLFQCFIMLFCLSYTPAMPIFLKHFPVFGRFTVAGLTYAISRAIIYIISSFGLIYCECCSKWWLLLIILPINIGFMWGIRHFECLEKQGTAYLPHRAIHH